jgi:hypothetical protein
MTYFVVYPSQNKILLMNMDMQQFNILNKTKTIALWTLKFRQKVCFIIIDMFVKYLCDHQNGSWENLFFGCPEKLLKRKSYTIRIRQRSFEWLTNCVFFPHCNTKKKIYIIPVAILIWSAEKCQHEYGAIPNNFQPFKLSSSM